MANIIYKHTLQSHGVTDLSFELGAKVLHAAVQNGYIRVWVLQPLPEPDAEVYMEARNYRFTTVYTGEDIADSDALGKHVSTVASNGIVTHVFCKVVEN